jgi:hypothetical protein
MKRTSLQYDIVRVREKIQIPNQSPHPPITVMIKTKNKNVST